MKKFIPFFIIFTILITSCNSDQPPTLSAQIKLIPVGLQPQALTSGLKPNTALVSCFKDNSVYELNIPQAKVTKKIIVRKGPNKIITDSKYKKTYCLHTLENALVILDGPNLKVTKKLSTGNISLANANLHPLKNQLWICDGTYTTAILTTPTIKRTRNKIQLGRYPQAIAFTPKGKLALITLKGENALALVNTNSYEETTRISTGIYPSDVVHTNNIAYVSNYGSHDISLIDIKQRKEITRLKVRKKPNALALQKNILWVACEGSYRIMAIDTQQATVIGSIKVGFYPGDILPLKDGTLLVTAPKKHQVALVKPSSLN